MKKLFSLLLAALILAGSAVSCTKQPADEGYLCDFPLPDLYAGYGNVESAFPLYLEAEPFRDTRGFDENGKLISDGYITLPAFWMNGDTVYSIARYRAEVIDGGYKALKAHETTGEFGTIHDLQIQQGDTVETIHLTGLEGRKIRFYQGRTEPDGSFTILAEDITDYTADQSVYPYFLRYDQNGVLQEKLPVQPDDVFLFPEYVQFCGNLIAVRNENVQKYDRDRYGHYIEPLTVYNPDTGELKTLSETTASFCCTDDSIYWMETEQEMDIQRMEFEIHRWLYRWDPVTDTSEKIDEVFSDNRFYHIRYDPDRNLLIYDDYKEMYVYDLDTDEEWKIMESTVAIQPVSLRDGRLTIKVASSGILIYDIPDTIIPLADSRTPIRFCMQSANPPDAPEDHAMQVLRANGYSVKSETVYAAGDSDEYAFTMAKKLLAGDTDFDIFYVSTEMAQLLKQEYFADLSKYAALDQLYDTLPSGMKELLSLDGMPALLPTDIRTNISVSDDGVFPQSLSDLTGMSLKSTSVRMAFSPLLEQFTANYMARRLSEKQALTDLTALMKTAQDCIAAGNVTQSGKLTFRNYAMSVKDSQTAAPMLLLGEDYSHAYNGGFWAINPNTQNPELAGLTLCTMLLYDMDRNILPIYEDEPDERGKLFLDQLKNSVLGYQPIDWNDRIREFFTALENGTHTPESTAEDMLRWLKMARDE